ncbi:MAG: hypothetical protein JW811_05245 [Clostridiales bacterium]|nr:hypothetical protein [Clostridiales bacterium]
MGMKFHKFYVAVINPLGILLLAVISVLMLLVALNAGLISEEANIPYISALEAGTVLWTLFSLAAAMFLFMMVTEFLLVARKRSGIVMLSASLILGIVSNVVSFVRYEAQTPWYSMAVTVVLSVLILAYYWRRYKTFG